MVVAAEATAGRVELALLRQDRRRPVPLVRILRRLRPRPRHGGLRLIQCPNEAYGCRSYVTYYAVDDHQRACPHVPCSCPEPGCGFAGSPSALLNHLPVAHSCPVDKVEYGKALALRVPASEGRRRLLVGEEDKRVAETAPQYRCKMWANAPAVGAASGKVDIVMVDMEVASSGAVAGSIAVEEATFLAVPPKMLHGEPEEIVIGICIDKKTS
ncbi:hypothetical protein E2562_023540 [Oryza meyeriana var. granulata]|uniref:SIAH-type domain-containing protein n=1 Tax=Oryza meyeriana var. granulata TaxID=110450 RepID=A0A6G1E0S5_9ORYZ|nr:hypothetical protein E2562_023540 [Oryza meyeriana var. granulata]